MKRFLFICFIIPYIYGYSSEKDTIFSEYYKESIKARSKGDIQLSIKLLEQTKDYWELPSDSAKVYNALGASYIRLTDFNLALIYLDSARVHADSSNLGYIYINYGLAYSNLTNQKKAIEYYSKALSLVGKDVYPAILHNIGKYYNNEDSSYFYFKKAFEIKKEKFGLKQYTTLLSGLELAEFEPALLDILYPYIRELNNHLLLGYYHTGKKNYKKAEEYLHSSNFQLLKLYAKSSQWLKALSMIDSLRLVDYNTLDSKLFLAANERLIYKNAIDFSLKEDTLKAFKVALRSRANILKDKVQFTTPINYPSSYNFFEFDSIIYLFHVDEEIKFHRIEADSTFWDRYNTFLGTFNTDYFKNEYNKAFIDFCTSGDFLFKKLIPMVNREMLIIPDGALHFLPFGALPTTMPDTSFPDYKSIDYLCQQAIITYDYFLRKYECDKRNHLEIVAIAPLEDLTHSQIEVRNLKKQYRAKAFAGSLPNTNELYSGDILHISTHYFPYEQYFSFGDRKLKIDSLQHKDWELVVIATCFSGFGVKHSGEGIFSPGRRFYNLGAKSIMESIWQSNDRSTSIIVKDFYKFLKKGDNKGEALNKAQLSYINKSRIQEHPYYWANLRIFGKTCPLKLKGRQYVYIIISLFSIGFISIVLFKNRTS